MIYAELQATIQLVKDGDFFQGVRIKHVESFLCFDADELEGDIDIVFFAVPGCFSFPIFTRSEKTELLSMQHNCPNATPFARR